MAGMDLTLTTIEDINNIFKGKVIERIEEDPANDGFIIVCEDEEGPVTMRVFRRHIIAQ